MNIVRKILVKNIFLLSVISLFLLSGCSSIGVQKDANWKHGEDTPVLVGHYMVMNQSGADLFDLAKQGAGDEGVSLKALGLDTYDMLEESLSSFGMALFFDADRATRLERRSDLSSGSDRVDELVGSAAGKWTHPKAARDPFHNVMSGTSAAKRIMEELSDGNEDEAYLSASLTLEDQSQWLLFKRHRLILDVKVFNNQGDVVFQAKTEGFTSSKFLRNPISGDRIRDAMAEALNNMEEAEVDDKISTIF